MTESDMKLPEGKTCSDCANYEDCRRLFLVSANSTVCDWSPSYFRQRETASSDGEQLKKLAAHALRTYVKPV